MIRLCIVANTAAVWFQICCIFIGWTDRSIGYIIKASRCIIISRVWSYCPLPFCPCMFTCGEKWPNRLWVAPGRWYTGCIVLRVPGYQVARSLRGHFLIATSLAVLFTFWACMVTAPVIALPSSWHFHRRKYCRLSLNIVHVYNINFSSPCGGWPVLIGIPPTFP